MSSRFLLQRLGVAACAAALAAFTPSLFAQISSSADYASLASDGFAMPSSLEYRTQYQNQYPSGGGYHQYKNADASFSKYAFQGGVGFAVPLGNTSNATADGSSTDANNTGIDFLLSGGYNLNKHFGANLEYRFDRLGIQNSILSYIDSACGSACSNGITASTHAWSFTVDPVYNVHLKGHWDGYVTGGGGFYRLLTKFSTPVPEGIGCYYYCSTIYGNQTVADSSSNQGGLNVGGGVVWKPNRDQHSGLFADVRYEWLDNPINNQTNNANAFFSSRVQVLPVTFGFRF